MNKNFRIFCGLLSWGFIFLMIGLLFGCATKSPVEESFNEAHQAIVVAKDSLSSECQTPEVIEKFESAKIKYEKAQNICEAKIKDVQIKYERSLWALFIIIFIFFAKNFIKK